jgi:glycerophosphoryl diester phosphodiesterase
LAAIPDHVGLALELKDAAFVEPACAEVLGEAIVARVKTGTVMLLSFHPELLEAARKAAPGVRVGLIYEYEPHPLFAGDGVGTTPHAMLANPGYMAEARRQSLWVCPLDTAPEPRLPWYLELGVDAVLSDDPATTIAALAALGAR